jgi:hypothetical protein
MTADPYDIRLDQSQFQIDLAAEQMIAAKKDHDKIAVLILDEVRDHD